MILDSLQFILKHPLNKSNKAGAVLNFIKWQINTRLNPYPIVYPFTENSKLLMWRGLKGATGNMYSGLHEFNDMGFLLHLLRPEDLFIDIGANIGSYTMLASGEINAHAIAIEPIPSTFKNLMNNIQLNNIVHRVQALNIGLGKAPGVIKFTNSLDAMNHAALDEEENTVDVNVDTLDAVVEKNDKYPLLLKIDVEGFETEVILGGKATIENTALKAIIIELNGAGKRYGYDEADIHQMFLDRGFLPFDYDPFTRKLTPIKTFGTHNTIYIRDFDFVKQRVESARKVKVRDTYL